MVLSMYLKQNRHFKQAGAYSEAASNTKGIMWPLTGKDCTWLRCRIYLCSSGTPSGLGSSVDQAVFVLGGGCCS